MENETLGERIKKRRKEMKMTLKDVQDKTGMLPQLISDYERGVKEPGVKNLKLLCKALEVTPNYFLGEGSDYEVWRINTAGNALYHYFEAIHASDEDRLVIDSENKRVFIEINNEWERDALINAKLMLEHENPEIRKLGEKTIVSVLKKYEFSKE